MSNSLNFVVRFGLSILISMGLLGAGFASDSVVLIQPNRAGPSVDIHTYVHPEWIKWPVATRTGDNKLLSLITGENWVGSETDSIFRHVSGRTWQSLGFLALNKRGHFVARSKVMDDARVKVVTQPSGATSLDALLFAVTPATDRVESVRSVVDLGGNTIYVASAVSWDDVMRVSRGAGGRTLVVEYPPPANQGWSRVWRLGTGWPAGRWTDPQIGLPGLVQARDGMSLLRVPDRFEWRPDDTVRWGGANRWLEFRQQMGPVYLCLLLVIVIGIAVWAAILASKESSHKWVLLSLEWCLLTPALIAFCGWVCSWTDLVLFSVLVPPASAGFLWLVGFLAPRLPTAALQLSPALGQRRIAAVALISGLTLGGLGITWSLLNPALEVDSPKESPIALGTFILALSLLVALSGRTNWVARGFIGIVLAFGISRFAWWGSGPSVVILLPLLAWLSGEGWLRLPVTASTLVFPPVLTNLMQNGWAWKPGGLLDEWADKHSVDGSLYVQALLNPLFIALALAVAGCGIFLDPFLIREVRRVTRTAPHVNRSLFLCGTVGMMGLLTPQMIPVATVMLLGICLLGLHFALSSNA